MTLQEQLEAAVRLAQVWAQIIPEIKPSQRQFITWVTRYGAAATEAGIIAVNAWITKQQQRGRQIGNQPGQLSENDIIRYASGCMVSEMREASRG